MLTLKINGCGLGDDGAIAIARGNYHHPALASMPSCCINHRRHTAATRAAGPTTLAVRPLAAAGYIRGVLEFARLAGPPRRRNYGHFAGLMHPQLPSSDVLTPSPIVDIVDCVSSSRLTSRHAVE